MIDYLTIRTWVITSIKDIIENDNVSITDNSYLEEDLGLDSLDIIDIVTSVEISINQIRENENKIKVDIAKSNIEFEIPPVSTVQGLVDYIYEEYLLYE